jgi:addiction module RelB/DinJ family antitoxin
MGVYMNTTIITARLDSNDKNTFASMCKDLGISTSTAINMFVRDCIKKQSILGLDCNISEEVDENGFTKSYKVSLDKSIEQLEQGKVVKYNFE